MSQKIRVATIADAASFMRIKDQLPITKTDGTTTTGGFILGTDINTYKKYIDKGFCLVAEVENKVVGFGIIFTDEMLRESDIWKRRSEATWTVDLSIYERRKLCYFEQLAFLPGHRKLVVALAYNLLKWAFDKGYNTVFTTTVKEPVLNLAAIPFINVLSGIKAGNINEAYPLIGHINSDIYLVESHNFYFNTANHYLQPFLHQNTLLIQ